MGVDVPLSRELQRLAALGWSADRFPATPEGVRVVGSAVDVNYPEQGFTGLGFDARQSYWFDHRARSVVDALLTATSARAIWDVGAGTGGMSVRLAAAGYDVVSVEPLALGAAAIAEKHCGDVFCGSLEGLGLPDDSIPIIGMFDVIEHLDDPSVLVAEVTRVLEPAGVLVATVPALSMLWSESDDNAGHQRRYTRRSLDTFMVSAGLERVMSAYLFLSLVLPAALLRSVPYRLGRRRSQTEITAATAKQLAPNPRVDAVATRVLAGERAVARRVQLPVGLSVLGAYRVPAR
jgi:SAM-dependent methyltransferase